MVAIQCGDHIFEGIQAIIFDKDGTLAAVESYLKNLGQKRARLADARVPRVQDPLLLAFGLEQSGLNPMGLLAVGSRRESEIAAAAYIAETGRDWAEALQIAAAAFQEADSFLPFKATHTPLLPGIGDWLAQLAASGLKLGILSADTADNIQSFIETYALNSSICNFQGAEGILSKPDPRLYDRLCQRLEVLPQHTMMIGDSSLDMIMGHAAGCAGCVGVTWGWSKPVAIAQADCIIQHPEQLQILKSG